MDIWQPRPCRSSHFCSILIETYKIPYRLLECFPSVCVSQLYHISCIIMRKPSLFYRPKMHTTMSGKEYLLSRLAVMHMVVSLFLIEVRRNRCCDSFSKVCLSDLVRLSVLSLFLSVCLTVFLSVWLFGCLAVSQSVGPLFG